MDCAFNQIYSRITRDSTALSWSCLTLLSLCMSVYVFVLTVAEMQTQRVLLPNTTISGDQLEMSLSSSVKQGLPILSLPLSPHALFSPSFSNKFLDVAKLLFVRAKYVTQHCPVTMLFLTIKSNKSYSLMFSLISVLS